MSAATEATRSSRDELERELRAAGAKFSGKNCTCPFHEDSHASASVFQGDDGAWRFACHVPTCGMKGDIFDVRARLQNRELADVLREASGNDRRDEPQRKPPRVFPTVDTIRESVSHLGQVEAVYQYTNPDTHAVEVVQVRYVSRDEEDKKFLTHHGVDRGFVLGAPPKPWPIYNRARVRAAQTVVIVEGEKCVHALHAVGIVATTSLSGSANATKANWSPLAGKTVYIWPDFDQAGMNYARDVIAKLDELHPRPEVWSLETSGLGLGEAGDAADAVAAGWTAEEIWTVLREASEPVGANSELLARIDAITSGKWKAIDFPNCPKLSAAAKALFPGTITVVCADPAGSKSLLLLDWCYRWQLNNVPVALLELEDDRAFHLLRLLAILAGTWEVLNDQWGRENSAALKSLYENHRAKLEAFAPSLHVAPLGQMNYPSLLDWIDSRCKAGAKIIGVDPITSIYAGESRHIEDLTFIMKASAILREHEARMIVVTHPRMGTGRRAGASQDDLAGGRAFSRHTQAVLWLHRHDPPKRFGCATLMGNMPIACNRTVYIAKARNGPGHGWKIGFNLDHRVQFAEQGLIVKDVEAQE